MINLVGRALQGLIDLILVVQVENFMICILRWGVDALISTVKTQSKMN